MTRLMKGKNLMSEWKESLIQHFSEGTTTWKESKLGVEVEHFIVDPANGCRAVPYAGEKGVRSVLVKLMDRYGDAQALEELRRHMAQSRPTVASGTVATLMQYSPASENPDVLYTDENGGKFDAVMVKSMGY